MSYSKNIDVLQELREADQCLRETHADLRAEAESETLRYLADHMRKWEHVLKETLDTIEKEMKESTASTFKQATPHGSPVERIQDHLPPPKEPADFVAWSLQRHEDLAEWCRTLGENSPNDRTATLFNSLADELKGINRQLAADTRSVEQGA
jgi:hypothetical protein